MATIIDARWAATHDAQRGQVGRHISDDAVVVHEQPPSTTIGRIDEQGRIAGERKGFTCLAIFTWSGAEVSDPSHSPQNHIRDDNTIGLPIMVDEDPSVVGVADRMEAGKRL